MRHREGHEPVHQQGGYTRCFAGPRVYIGECDEANWQVPLQQADKPIQCLMLLSLTHDLTNDG